MFFNLIGILILALIAWVIYRTFISPKAPSVDYSFGRNDFKNITKWYKACSYTQVEQAVKQLNSDDLTQLCDCLALSLSEKNLLSYHTGVSDKSFSSLILGVYHSHMAWKSRGRGYGSSVSEKQANIFFEQLQLAVSYLTPLTNHPAFSAEVNARLIRVCMGLNEFESAAEFYQNSISADPNHLWAYIHYAELIQPKWGESETEIVSFFKSLPDNSLIQTVIKLKLYYDGLIAGMNYFDVKMDTEDFNDEILAYVKELDASNTLFRVLSIHKYVIYGYMFSLASNFAEKQMSQKYWNLLENRMSLYPFGLQ